MRIRSHPSVVLLLASVAGFIFTSDIAALVWQSNLASRNVVDGHWSGAACAEVNGRAQVVFAGGDGVIYSFAPTSGKLLWKCDCLPFRAKGEFEPNDYFIGSPVVVGDRLYIGMGQYTSHHRPTKQSYFLCLDIAKTGDVSLKSYDAKAAENKESALVWTFGADRKRYFGNTMSTVAVRDGLVYVPEDYGYLHCFDAKTGKRYWVHDFISSVWGSPMWVDGKVYVGTEDWEVVIFAHGKRKKLLAKIEMDEIVHSTPVVANGVLYVITRDKLYAIEQKKIQK